MVNKITTPPTTSELIDKVNEIIDDKQDTLVSGTNIKTINNTSILGGGNIDIQGGGSSYTAGTGIDITNDEISVDNTVALKSEIPTATSDLTNDSGFITSSALTPYALTSSLATVATTGDYDDLTNKPNSLINTATGKYSLTINGKSTSKRRAYNIGTNSSSLACGVAYGDGADAGEFGVSIGYTSACNSYGVALGYNAHTGLGSIQIGYGTNSQSMTMAVGFFNGSTAYEYQLLNGTTGLIPDARISSNIARTSNIPSATSDLTNDSGFITSSAIDTMLAALYPVGSIYIGTQSTCPLATLISGSTWTKVSKGRVLQGADSSHSANSTIAAGLPNITGETYSKNDAGSSHYANTYSGVFRGRNTGGTSYYAGNPIASSDTNIGISFAASRSNSIYGASSTVQPPAYCVNIWRRTA